MGLDYLKMSMSGKEKKIEKLPLGKRKLKRHDNYIEQCVILDWILGSPTPPPALPKRNSSIGDI